MSIDYALHNSQPDPGSLVVLGSLQTLEYAKQLLDITHIETNTIVPHIDYGLSILASTRDLDFGLNGITRELKRVGQQVCEYLAHQCRVTFTPGQRSDITLDALFSMHVLELGYALFHQGTQINQFGLHRLSAQTCEFE